MRILIVLTYYRPHTSGLTIYAERLAKALARRGHQVTVLTSHFKKSLPYEEIKDGVKIIRVPVLFRLSKGTIMPTFGAIANRLVLEHDVIQLHLPQVDAAGVALRGRLLKKPTVITYHCDLKMPPGLLSWAANQAVILMNHLAARSTHRIVTYTEDYAVNSPYLKNYLSKLKVIRPPVELPEKTDQMVADFASLHNPDGRRPVIGLAARFASEKGVEVLLHALPKILEVFPNAMVQFAGPYRKILGEEGYFDQLSPQINSFIEKGAWHFAGELNPKEMAAFYPNLDVLVLPSLNSTEAFGLVQIEAMMNGVPCVASNLPGVRQPVMVHGMGKIIPIGDTQALAENIIEILQAPERFKGDPESIAQIYLPDAIAAEYEILFDKLLEELNPGRKAS
ncbi:MAG: glycosyltransferase family 4 protein [Anaerolineaceae bacterium]